MTAKNKYFPLPLLGRFVGKGKWKLTSIFEYHPDEGNVVTVPIGFIVDGASIPRLVQSIVGSPWNGGYVKPSVIHDWRYYKGEVTRKFSDQEFRLNNKRENVKRWKRPLIYYGLRIGGWIGWNRRRKEEKE